MKIFNLFFQKKWWNLLLFGFLNSVFFVLLFSLAFLYLMPGVLFLLILPFLLLVWGLSSASLSKFFGSTLLFIATFIFAFPLSGRIYAHFYERLYPDGIYGSGPSLALFLFFLFYMIMSFFAWLIALAFTLQTRKQSDMPKDMEE